MPEASLASYSVRPYRDDDAEVLSDICLAAIRDVGSRAYSEAQIAAWSARHRGAEMYRERVADGHMIFVAVDAQDVPVAYALLEADGHLDRLYNHPRHTRRGLAGRLLATAEARARELGIARLYTEASDLARPAFERAGYSVTQRRDFEIEHEGKSVPIHNWAMERALS